MKAKNENLMRELRKIDPLVSDRAAINGTDPRLPDQALLAGILATDPEQGREPTLPARNQRRLRFRPVLVPTVAVAALLLIVVVALLGGSGGTGNGVLGPLNEVAEVAASQDPPPKSIVSYSKVRFNSLDTAIAGGEAWSFYRSELREEWRSESEPGRLRVTSFPPQFVGPGDKAAWEAAGRPSFLPDSSDGTDERTLPPASEVGGDADVSRLPLDPGALLDEVNRRASRIDSPAPPQARALLLIAELLQNPAASPDLRTSLYRAAEMVPGVQAFGETQDQIGRSGIAIGVESSFSGERTRYELIFDPDTSEVMATAAIGLEHPEFADVAPPYLLETTLFLASRT